MPHDTEIIFMSHGTQNKKLVLVNICYLCPKPNTRYGIIEMLYAYLYNDYAECERGFLFQDYSHFSYWMYYQGVPQRVNDVT